MQGNQGLEALAALCGGQTDAPIEGRLARLANGSVAAGGAPSSSSCGPAVIGAQQSQSQAVQHAILHAAAAAARGNNTQLTQQFPLQNLTPQQWQQALAATVAQQGGGLNPALTAQNFFLTAGVVPQQQHQQQQQQQNVSNNNAGLEAIQKLVYFQMLQQQQQQTKLAPQHSAPAMNGGISFTDQAQQAILMAIAAGKVQQRPQTNGKFPHHYLMQLCLLQSGPLLLLTIKKIFEEAIVIVVEATHRHPRTASIRLTPMKWRFSHPLAMIFVPCDIFCYCVFNLTWRTRSDASFWTFLIGLWVS
jgi:hypothetical protein